MRFFKDLLEDDGDSINSGAHLLRGFRVCEGNEVDALEGVPYAIVHPFDGFKISNHFEASAANSKLPAEHYEKCESGCEQNAGQLQRTPAVHPVVIDKPLQEGGKAEDI